LEHATPALDSQINAVEGILKEITGKPDKPALSYLAGDLIVEPKTVSPERAWSIMKVLDDIGDAAKVQQFGQRFGPTEAVANKQTGNAALSAAEAINETLDVASKGRFDKEFNKPYSQVAQAEQVLSPWFNDKTKQRAYSKLSNLFNQPNAPTFEKIQEIDQLLPNADIVGTADLVKAHKVFAQPQWFPRSAGGTTSTSRSVPGQEAAAEAGYAGGAHLGKGFGRVMSYLARMAAGPVTGPRAIKGYVRAGKRLDSLGEILGALQDARLAPTAPQVGTPWLQMQLDRYANPEEEQRYNQ
jgi:hypothetical protein